MAKFDHSILPRLNSILHNFFPCIIHIDAFFLSKNFNHLWSMVSWSNSPKTYNFESCLTLKRQLPMVMTFHFWTKNLFLKRKDSAWSPLWLYQVRSLEFQRNPWLLGTLWGLVQLLDWDCFGQMPTNIRGAQLVVFLSRKSVYRDKENC